MRTDVRDHAARSWPPTEAVERDGWLLRSTPRVDRARSNSALPLVPDPDIAVVDAFYAERGVPARVQLAPRDGHPALSAELDRRGWEAAFASCVLLGELAAVGPDAGAAEILDAPEPRWVAAWAACEGRDPQDAHAHAEVILSQLAGRAAFALLPDGAGAGLAVAGEGLCGLFSLAIDPEQRRAGRGTALVRALAAWGARRGAREVYLEVEERNTAALALYSRLGLGRAYRYVHRRAPR